MCTIFNRILATSAAQPHGTSVQMQRWLKTPRCQEPYVVGYGIRKEPEALLAEVDQALPVIQKGAWDGKS